VSDNTSSAASFYEAFLKQAALDYPETSGSYGLRDKLSSNLISPHVTELPASYRHQAQEIVNAFFALRNSPSWLERQKNVEPALQDPGNASILMSYDFHVDASGQLRLIEVNTNASLSLVVDLIHRVHGIDNPFSANFREELLDCFSRELKDSAAQSGQAASGGIKNIAIVDETPEQQRLFAEFKLFQELFGTRGWHADFFDPTQLKFSNGQLTGNDQRIDLVYNRDTDFYFKKESSQSLRLAMEEKAACITPHPFEYRLLADKERLLELSREEILNASEISESEKEVIRKTLIRTVDIHSIPAEQLWKERKKWFFKPRNSHGGKAVYRGSSTSRTTFEQILGREYLAQEMVPPAVLKFKNEAEEFKSDLRFYVYRNRIQLACARLYRGQMTNAQTPGGGVSVINWT
jgi:hypothetical protein